MSGSAETPGSVSTNSLNGGPPAPSAMDLFSQSNLLRKASPPPDSSPSSDGGDDGGQSAPPLSSDSGGNNNTNDNKTSPNSPPAPPGNSSSSTPPKPSPSGSPTSPPPLSPPPSPPPSQLPKSTPSPPPESSPPPPPSPEQQSPSPPPPSQSQSQSQSPPSPPTATPPQSPPQSQSPPAIGNASQSPPPPPASSSPKPTPPASPGLSPPPPRQPGSTPSSPSPHPPSNWYPPPATKSAASPPIQKETPSTPGSQLGSGANANSAPKSSNTTQKAVVGVALASVFLIALVAIFFVVSKRRRRRRADIYAAAYMPPGGGNLSVKSDGYYYGQQQHSKVHSGQMDPYQPPSHSNLMSNYGSQRGQMYGGPESGVIGGGKSHFSYEELMEITGGFCRDNIIGEGGFGCVYKGWLSDGRVVAVKQLKAGSGQGEREFRAEVEIISRVHHRHLVSLVGFCIAESHRSLIYEFVPNDTLEHHLHAKGLPVLDWTKRVKIAIGAAKGLAYLHEDCHPKIIHRDIKSANILLEDDFEAKVADFGLAKLNDTTQTHVSTRVMGTFGYLAPEYASSGKLTDRSDVFSFGVVLLELITGRKPVDPTQPLGDESLVEWARPLLVNALQTGNISELVDPRLEKHYIEFEVLRMIEAAAACVRHSAPKRPRMVQVVRALDSDGEMSDLSNGVKYGQSTVYDSGQYNQDIMKFRMMALGSDSSSMDYDMHSGDYTSREGSRGFPNSWKSSGEFTSGESETRAMNGYSRVSPRF